MKEDSCWAAHTSKLPAQSPPRRPPTCAAPHVCRRVPSAAPWPRHAPHATSDRGQQPPDRRTSPSHALVLEILPGGPPSQVRHVNAPANMHHLLVCAQGRGEGRQASSDGTPMPDRAPPGPRRAGIGAPGAISALASPIGRPKAPAHAPRAPRRRLTCHSDTPPALPQPTPTDRARGHGPQRDGRSSSLLSWNRAFVAHRALEPPITSQQHLFACTMFAGEWRGAARRAG